MLHEVVQAKACNEEFIGMALRDTEGINAFSFNLQVGKAGVCRAKVLTPEVSGGFVVI